MLQTYVGNFLYFSPHEKEERSSSLFKIDIVRPTFEATLTCITSITNNILPKSLSHSISINIHV